MRAGWVSDDILNIVLMALMPENRLVLRVARATGLRIGDVLALKTSDLEARQRYTIKEQKTGKGKRVLFPASLRDEMLRQAGRYWVFEGRTDPKKHRTRQAVNKDLARACKLFRVSGLVDKDVNISPHSTRKGYAVARMDDGAALEAVQREFNHSDSTITMLYALAREMQQRPAYKARKRRKP